MAKTSWLDSIFHAVTEDFISPLPVKVANPIEFTLRVAKPHNISEIYFRCAPEGSGRFWSLKLKSSDAHFDYFSLQFAMQWKVMSYRFFILTASGENYWYNNRGIFLHEPADVCNFTVIAEHNVPEWILDRVFYQIFPDRFYNGNPARDYKAGEIAVTGETIKVKAWGDAPEGGFDFFNGDLDGVVQKLDHLQRLGVNALYLTPIFLAPSNHKYDIQDYFSIDPHLGDDAVFSKLCNDLHAREMHIVLDGIFNHCGAAHRWFNRYNAFDDVGAYNSVDSAQADYFIFYQHPHSYEGWWGHDSLPKLDYRSQKLRDAIYRNADSAIQYWLAPPRSIDGWRFDVANMTARLGTYQAGREVWTEVRTAVKANYPDSYLLGEHFYDGTDLLQGDALDGNMNYIGFYYPILHWLSGKFDFGADGSRKTVPHVNFDGIAFQQQLVDYFSITPWQHAIANYSLLNSHDRPRMITLLNGDLDRLRTALLFLFTYVGIPSVYYGDEVGLPGGADPDCRRCMEWDESRWNQPLFELYQSLITLRKTTVALQKGALQWLLVGADVVAYARFLAGQTVITVLASTPSDQLCDVPLLHLGLGDNENWRSIDSGSAVVQATGGALRVPMRSAVYLRDDS